MKLLLLLSGGIGNIMQTVPMYLQLKKHHEVDVEYLPQFDGESAGNAACFPNPIIQETSRDAISKDKYEYIIKTMPTHVYSGDGQFLKEWEDTTRENSTEFEAYMRILDFFKIKRKIEREWREKECEKPKEYISLHNGGLNTQAWIGKKYMEFGQLAYLIQTKMGIPCVSLGSPQEFIYGTENYTGRSLRESAHLIRNSLLHISTDTGSYHIGGLMDHPGIALFTMTDQNKNYDKEFHKKIDTIQRDDLDCCPCQWGNCWSPERPCKGRFWCRDIPVESVYEIVEKRLCET